jgi:protein-S-isoprenylcysteine O-methyltransferase Ste14
MTTTQAIMRIPPPLLFVATFLVGVGIERLAPLSLYPAALLPVQRIVAALAIGAGVLLAFGCASIFMLVRTTIIPSGAASTLVVRGPYRLTRNPMYVSLVLVYLGVALMLHVSWPLLLLPFPLVLIHRVVIPFEEARLRELFGSEFERYCNRVHRWV